MKGEEVKIRVSIVVVHQAGIKTRRKKDGVVTRTNVDQPDRHGTTGVPVMGLDGYGGNVEQASCNAHTYALREEDLVVLARVGDGEHEQAAIASGRS